MNYDDHINILYCLPGNDGSWSFTIPLLTLSELLYPFCDCDFAKIS